MHFLWEQCAGDQHIKSITCTAFRVVEDQSRTATRQLVNTIEEHDTLEKLLDEKSKPPYPKELKLKDNYLLKTPFRYPPLKWGSRFGKRTERGLWYGSLKEKTALCEMAYLAFRFRKRITAKTKDSRVHFTSYSAPIETVNGIDLTGQPFNSHTSSISDPCSYSHSQELGKAMRAKHIDAFIYHSSREPNEKNLGILNPAIFENKKPTCHKDWDTFITEEVIEFFSTTKKDERHIFPISHFLINGEFPLPQT